MKIIAVLVLILCLAWGQQMNAAQIGFEETFALSGNRAETLKQLIPGTEDFYYYSCLHHEQLGEHQKVAEILEQWIKRYSYSARVQEIQNRYMLQTYDRHPDKTIEHIRQKLNLTFQHQKRQEKQKTSLPTRIADDIYGFAALEEMALRDYSDLSGFETSAMPIMLKHSLNADQRRHLLQQLERPEGKNLVRLVVADLRHDYSGGFGSIPLHSRLTLAQLDECLEQYPDLINQSNFVLAYLKKLRPSEDTNLNNDPESLRKTLHEMWLFARKLAPAFNSLKAHLTYHLLDFDRKAGKYNRTLFLEYLKFPRRVSYMNRKYYETKENLRHLVDFSANYQPQTMMRAISNDEELIRDYFTFIFQTENEASPYFEYIDSNYLLKLLAETKIIYGLGDMEKWYSMLDPQEVNRIRERIELEFLPTCKNIFKPEENVEIDIRVKNVKKLIVKVYQINSLNFYRENQAEITTAIDLDGLVANIEKTCNYDLPDHRRHHEKFSFPELPERGIFVVEIIGNGISSRALVRKGQLNYMAQATSAGQILTIFNESAQQVKDAKIWMDGREYDADNRGHILIPFSTNPGQKNMIIREGDFASLQKFDHHGESYELNCGLYVDREALIEGKKASVIVRPLLKVNGMPADIKLLKEVSLSIATMDSEGIPAVKEVADFELCNDRESTFEFAVPEKLTQIAFVLKGKVDNLSNNRKDELAAEQQYTLNRIAAGDKTEAILPIHAAGGYMVAVLGRSGEPVADRPIQVEIKNRYFRRSIFTSLQTDSQGQAHLGRLEDIDWVKISANDCESQTLYPTRDQYSQPSLITATGEDKISIPVFGGDDQKAEDLFCFFEMRNDSYYRDLTGNAFIKNGFIELTGLEPGDYELFLKKINQTIEIKITGGRKISGYAVSANRILQLRPLNPLHISSVKHDIKEAQLKVQLSNFGPDTRVHLVATRFMPDFLIYPELADPGEIQAELLRLMLPESKYLSGRNIGDEYKYILERRYADIFAGNMLRRPGLLLNPWSLRKTDTSRRDASGGDTWGGSPERERSRRSKKTSAPQDAKSQAGNDSFVNLDFLPGGSIVMSNLTPDREGRITINVADLLPAQHLHIMAIDRYNSVFTGISLEKQAEKPVDICMRRALDPEQNFSEQKNISIVAAGKDFAIEDITTAKLEVYDSLASVYRLFNSLNPDPKLAEFSFITNWNSLDDAKKLELYSKNACHELNFFIYKKDRGFFDKVVKPYIANKHDKTFLDNWLIDRNLDQYLEPWAFGRLNIVEKILLGTRLDKERKRTGRHVEDLFDLLPKDIDKFNQLFKTAIKGSSLETDDTLGFAAGLNEAMSALPPSPMAEPAPEMVMRAVMPAVRAPKPSAPMGAKMKMQKDEAFESDKMMAMEESEAYFDDGMGLEAAAGRRQEVKQFFRQLDTTEEWVENNYYKLPIEQQTAALITVNEFWKDFALNPKDQPFVSRNVAMASRNFSEMMLALAVLDLPFKAEKHETGYKVARMTLKAGNDAIIFHREIRPVSEVAKTQSILVGQNFFAANDRYFFEKNERFDKFVTEEFLTRRVYGCQVVMTNPTSSRKNVDVLMQIPNGAIPVLNGFYTRSLNFQLEPFSTRTHEFYFYFPFAGTFPHYPVHVSEEETMIAAGKPFVFKVVSELTSFDKTSWPYIAENGMPEDVLDYLQHNNIDRLDLNLMAFRLKNREFFEQAYALLKTRRVYHDTTWSYGLYHRNISAINEYLAHSQFANMVGSSFSSPLLSIDPVARHSYQHREYWPLVNARVYLLGKKREILNQQFADQYQALLSDLRYRKRLEDHDLMAITYYMLLQDRIEEALATFASISSSEVKATIQYAYMAAYLAFYREEPQKAVAIAASYKDYPVLRWRNLFNDVLAQAAEIDGSTAKIIDSEDREQKQAVLADTTPDFEFSIENRRMKIRHQNLDELKISYYLMDIELLFSRKPFVQEVSGQFSVIRPNETQILDLKGSDAELELNLPEKFSDSNVMVEISAAGIVRSQAYYPHSLAVSLAEQYGQVRISQQKTGRPLAKVYVKVYSRMKDGQVIFYKDGYTDLRGKFDYASLSTDQLDQVDRFAILIMSESNGSLVREAAPPAR